MKQNQKLILKNFIKMPIPKFLYDNNYDQIILLHEEFAGMVDQILHKGKITKFPHILITNEERQLLNFLEKIDNLNAYICVLFDIENILQEYNRDYNKIM